MAFKQVTSPHAHGAKSTANVMKLVVLATYPRIDCIDLALWLGLFN
jgi:electron transport complex protein RnfD